MAQYYTPVQSGVGNPRAHFGQEVFNPVLAELETLAYYQSGWYTLVDWTTLGGSTASLTLSGISGAWRHLRFMGTFRSTQGAASDTLCMTVTPAAPSYYFNSIEINGSTGFVTGAASVNMRIVANSAPAGYSPVLIDIYSYPEGELLSINYRAYAHSTNASAGMFAVLGGSSNIRSEGAITALTFTCLGSNITIGSMYALYGMDR